MVIVKYKTKTLLKEAIGKKLNYKESSQFGTEYQSTGTFEVVAQESNWKATVTMEDDIIKKVE